MKGWARMAAVGEEKRWDHGNILNIKFTGFAAGGHEATEIERSQEQVQGL